MHVFLKILSENSETSVSCASCFIGGSSLRETDAATFGSVLVYRYTGADTKIETIHYNRKLMKQWLLNQETTMAIPSFTRTPGKTPTFRVVQ